MVTDTLCAGLAVALALLVAILLKVATLPGALRAQARRDRAEGRAEGQAEAFTALQEAAAAKVGGIVVAIQAYEERSASLVRDELAASEVRARVSERRAADTMPLLGAASELVRELRRTVDGLADVAMLVTRSVERAAKPEPEPAPDSASRRTTEMKAPPSYAAPPGEAGEEEPEEELTTVAERPRPALPPPAAALSAGRGARRPTILGISPPGERPPLRSAPTLLSMQPITAPARKDGGA